LIHVFPRPFYRILGLGFLPELNLFRGSGIKDESDDIEKILAMLNNGAWSRTGKLGCMLGTEYYRILSGTLSKAGSLRFFSRWDIGPDKAAELQKRSVIARRSFMLAPGWRPFRFAIGALGSALIPRES
jgi:hypothetical protein